MGRSKGRPDRLARPAVNRAGVELASIGSVSVAQLSARLPQRLRQLRAARRCLISLSAPRGGEGWVRWGIRQLLAQALQHPVQVVHYLVVPEPDGPVAVRCDFRRARRVGRALLGVLAPVQLDHQLAFRAGEDGDTPPDWVLAAEPPGQPAIPQSPPQAPLRLRASRRSLRATMVCVRTILSGIPHLTPALSAPRGGEGALPRSHT